MGKLTITQTETLEEILINGSGGVPYLLQDAPTFSLTDEQKAALEKHLKEAFELYMDSWILHPLAAMLEQHRFVSTNKRGA